jgi:hypothetical protein
MRMRAMVVVFWGLVGCHGGGSGEIDGGGSAFATPSAFCRAYAEKYDAKNFQCLGGQGLSTAAVPSGCGGLDAALAKKLISYDASAGEACLAELDHFLDTVCNRDQPCVSTVVKGLLADGAPCGHWMECQPGSLCRRPFDMCAPAVCTPGDLLLGDVCGGSMPTRKCGEGLTCSAAKTCVEAPRGGACAKDEDCLSSSEFCDGAACKPRLAVGVSCAGKPEACALLGRCDATTHLCVAAGVVGQACGGFELCWSSYCPAPDLNGDALPCAARKAVGAPCDDGAQCDSGLCKSGACVACTL